MTAEEVENISPRSHFQEQRAFLEKYKDKTTEEQMIGHFGLGFYSAFMVADKFTLILFLIKKAQQQYTGSARAVQSMICMKKATGWTRDHTVSERGQPGVCK